MKGVILNKKLTRDEKNVGLEFFLKFLILPTRSGLYGFAAFFTLLIAAKFFWYLIGFKDWFTVTVDDVTISLLGFAIVFIVRIAQNFKTASW